MESAYLHALDGRIRIKLAGVKSSPATASRVEEHLGGRDGIVEVRANSVTGNVLILYDPQKVQQATLIEELRPFGATGTDSSGAAVRLQQHRPARAQRIAESVITTIFEVAMRELVSVLI